MIEIVTLASIYALHLYAQRRWERERANLMAAILARTPEQAVRAVQGSLQVEKPESRVKHPLPIGL